MENNEQETRWVDDRMSALEPGAEWKPDAVKGLVRLRDRHGRGSVKGRRWLSVVAVGVVTSLGLMALPSSRSFAGRCLDFCTTELSHVSLMDLHNWLVGSFLGFLHPSG